MGWEKSLLFVLVIIFFLLWWEDGWDIMVKRVRESMHMNDKVLCSLTRVCTCSVWCTGADWGLFSIQLSIHIALCFSCCLLAFFVVFFVSFISFIFIFFLFFCEELGYHDQEIWEGSMHLNNKVLSSRWSWLSS
ncbi:MAG: hypothetical protein BYD32DRAFT_422282 [Podila humilis]|nr:MAG: hypothetical protein BYD32DRAFT_422282 [Podila humilis]